jgi:hypothetical protein
MTSPGVRIHLWFFLFIQERKMNYKIGAIKANLRILLTRFEDMVVRKSISNNSNNIDEIFTKLEEVERGLTEFELIIDQRTRKISARRAKWKN